MGTFCGCTQQTMRVTVPEIVESESTLESTAWPESPSSSMRVDNDQTLILEGVWNGHEFESPGAQ